MKNFADFRLPKPLADSLITLNYDTPTPIQAQAIPHALDGRDVLGSAQTGTGKTAAFLIPVLAKLFEDETASALIMSPTRELATQIMDMARKLMGHKSGIRTALLIGGEPMFKQFKQLSARPRLIIGTPGRIDDHCRRNRTLLDTTHTLVLDEADRMLDMGFSVQIDSILKYMPDKKHTMMFSATFSDKIIKFAQHYLNNPVRVAVKPEKITADRIKHDIAPVRNKEDKFKHLLAELETRSGSIIIFVKTKRNADHLAQKLSDTGNDNIAAQAIHGDLRQRQRDRTIKGFQMKTFRILVATDVASRGLDIPHVEHVINYDLPQNPEDYIHRIGRTARAGAEGNALCFITPSEGRDWAIIERMVFPNKTPSQKPYNDNRCENSSFSNKKYGNKKSFGKKSNFRSKDESKPSHRSNKNNDQKRWEPTGKPSNRHAQTTHATQPTNRSERPNYDKNHSKRGNSEAFADHEKRSHQSKTGNNTQRFNKDGFKSGFKSSFGKKNRDNKPQGDNGEGFAKRREHGGSRTQDNRTERSQGFKKSGNFSGKKPSFSKPSRSFKKAV